MDSAFHLIPQAKDKLLWISDYQFSEDGNYLMIFTNTRKVWTYRSRCPFSFYQLLFFTVHSLFVIETGLSVYHDHMCIYILIYSVLEN